MQCTFLTHIDINKSPLKSLYPASSSPVIINANSYLGARVVLMKGIEIGENSIVAAGAIVNTNIDSNCLAGGTPATLIKKIEIE